VPSPFVSGFAQKRKEHPARTLAGCRHLSRISVVLNIRSLQNLSNCRVLSIVCSSCTLLLQGLPSFQSRIPRCWSGQSDFSTICTEAICGQLLGNLLASCMLGLLGRASNYCHIHTHQPVLHRRSRRPGLRGGRVALLSRSDAGITHSTGALFHSAAWRHILPRVALFELAWFAV